MAVAEDFSPVPSNYTEMRRSAAAVSAPAAEIRVKRLRTSLISSDDYSYYNDR